MVKKYILLLLILQLSISWGKAQLPLNQESYADSLNKSLKLNVSDSTKARTFFLLSYYYHNKHEDQKSKSYLEKGKELVKKYPYLQAISYFYESVVFLQNDTLKSKKAALKGNQLLLRYSNKEAYLFRAQALNNIAAIQQNHDHVKIALDMLLNQIIPLAKKSGDSLKLAAYYTNVAMIFTNSSERSKAETYYNLAIEMSKNLSHNSPVLAKAYILASINYNYSFKFPQSKSMLDKAKAILANHPKSEIQPNYYFSEGNYFEGVKQYKSALKSYDKGIAVAKELKLGYLLQGLRIQKFSALANLKDYKAAQPILDSVAKDNDFMTAANNRKSIFKYQAKNNFRLGNIKTAYWWLERHGQLSDSIYNSKINTDINTLEAKFRSVENKKRISELTAANEKAKYKANTNLLMNWLLGSVSLFLALMLVGVFLFFQDRKKLKELNYQQELKYLDQQYQVKLTRAMINGQDEERNRLGRDLHDGLGGMLAAVKINLSGWSAKSSMTDDQELGSIVNRLDNSITELRSIAGNLMPVSLLKFGLEVSLRDLSESFMSDSLVIDFQCLDVIDGLPVDQQMTIYRIVQELLNNVAKHSKAKNVLLQCSLSLNNFMITIEDDGVGFDMESLKEKKGMGISNIKTRVAYLDGKFDIVSGNNGQGTNVNIELKVSI
ncbi:tetratricopeptide repeat-containing sensor histidine kinase [Pedobacter alluvionis]|uniref:histidine kinase n=1 Tax=Pedobacter alluvionis TaxID=475253 RepID=A0A497XN35_9SPHI|nr:sensor histidine kinase [Pedobacter alluvionis]RLJ69308.1 histidine kinase/DNA gyrase B/HSP90-like ATPase [Pedobacter alluvionis]TFB30313.1 sensor histidine kinase [Pedobacter alluvionis]